MAGNALLAGAPIVAILVLMVAARWSAAKAGLAGLVAATVVGVGAFGFGRGDPATLSGTAAAGGVAAESVFTAATILWIIVPALAIHHLQTATGSTDVLQSGLGRLTGDPRLLALLVAWFFVLFIEGAAGFGASVALAAPFLVSAGFRRVDAVVIALIGHAVGVSFGAVGTPIVPQVAMTGLSGMELARATASYHALIGWTLLLAMLLVVGRSLPEGHVVTGRTWTWGMLAGALFFVPFTLLAAFVGPELPTLGGALAGGAVFAGALLLARRWRSGGSEGTREVADSAAARQAAPMLRAAAPYLVLVTAVLFTRLVPVVRESLTAVTFEWEVAGRFAGSVAPLYHPGTMLLAGFVVGAMLQSAGLPAVRRALRTTVGQLGAVAVALVAMLAISRIMVHAGMTESLATAAAAAAGGGWPLLAPLVGVLGTFVAGSATASNILFTEFQVATAESLGLPIAPIAGAQGLGAAVGNIVCPHNIIAAGATVAIDGREGEVLRRTVGVALGYAAAGGALAWLFTAV